MIKPPDKDRYMDLVQRTIRTYRAEDAVLRPRDDQGRGGGIVFLPKQPYLIVPDLHGRIDFLQDLLEFPMGGASVFHRLREGSLGILCLGDGLHSEQRGFHRWRRALREFAGGYKRHRWMDEEMGEGLELMRLVMELKCSFPRAFHFLKGNHENILNEEGRGNHPFRKYALEGEMVRSYLLHFYGEDFLSLYADFERELPLLAVGENFLASHAEPRRFFSREELIGYRNRPDVIEGCSWTANDEAEEGSVKKMLSVYCPADADGFARYFGGHRSVDGAYRQRADGLYIQLHNPRRNNTALVIPGRLPDPDRDIFDCNVFGSED